VLLVPPPLLLPQAAASVSTRNAMAAIAPIATIRFLPFAVVISVVLSSMAAPGSGVRRPSDILRADC
jgi:hypothetical protein